MTQTYSTSAKVLSYYCDTRATKRLMTQFGDRLERLEQEELYQLLTAIGLHLWGQCQPPEPIAELDIFDKECDIEPDLIADQDNWLVPEISANTMSALVILQHEPPENLAQLLPAIAEYARDHG